MRLSKKDLKALAREARTLLKDISGEVHHWYANNLDPTQHMRDCPGCRVTAFLTSAASATPMDLP